MLNVESHLQSESLTIQRTVQAHQERTERSEGDGHLLHLALPRAWVTDLFAASAPNNDLLLLKSLVEYKARNQAISKAATTNLADSLWYLSEELTGIAFSFSSSFTRMYLHQ